MVEATAVERIGRITHGCLGLYSDANEAALARVLTPARRVAAPGTRFAIQIAHAGRKASCQRPWEGGKPLRPARTPWQTVAPSAIPFRPRGRRPRRSTRTGLERVKAAFCQAAERAVRLGFDAIELHGAHGYLLHAFVSPLSNQRNDAYGGSPENRMRFPLEVARAVRAVVPRSVALGARITGTDWADGGLTPTMRWRSPPRSRRRPDYVCVSGGGAVPNEDRARPRLPGAVGRQGEGGDRDRHARRRPDRRARQAEAIIASGQADFVALARAFLDDPRWVWHAAERLGAEIPSRRPTRGPRAPPGRVRRCVRPRC